MKTCTWPLLDSVSLDFSLFPPEHQELISMDQRYWLFNYHHHVTFLISLILSLMKIDSLAFSVTVHDNTLKPNISFHHCSLCIANAIRSSHYLAGGPWLRLNWSREIFFSPYSGSSLNNCLKQLSAVCPNANIRFHLSCLYSFDSCRHSILPWRLWAFPATESTLMHFHLRSHGGKSNRASGLTLQLHLNKPLVKAYFIWRWLPHKTPASPPVWLQTTVQGRKEKVGERKRKYNVNESELSTRHPGVELVYVSLMRVLWGVGVVGKHNSMLDPSGDRDRTSCHGNPGSWSPRPAGAGIEWEQASERQTGGEWGGVKGWLWLAGVLPEVLTTVR